MKLLKTPWWLSALLAVFSYYFLKYLSPDFLPTNLGNFMPTLAPIIAMGFLLHSGAMLYEGDKRDDNDPERQEEEKKESVHKE